MSVRIRLKRMGSKKKPFYRLIASDSRMPRDGRFLETVGYYNPMTNPPDIHVNEEALFKWLGDGATPTESAAGVLKTVGSLQKWNLVKAGVTGEELETKVEAIKNQRLAKSQRKDLLKTGEKSKKAVEKEAVEAKAATEKVAADEAEAVKAAEAKAAEVASAEPAPEETPAAEPEVAAEAPKVEEAPAAEPEVVTEAPKVEEAQAAPADEAPEAPAAPESEETKKED